MQLMMSQAGHSYRVERLLGREKQQQLLENMGFVPGATLKVVSDLHTNLIILIKNTRIGLSRELAQKVLVEEIAEEDWEAVPTQSPERRLL